MRLPLRAVLFVSLVAAALAPIAYLGPTQIARWREVQQDDADKELRLAAESLARSIGQTLDSSARELTAMASQIGIRGDLDADYLRSVLHQFRQTFPSWLGVNVSNLAAEPIAFDPPLVGRVRYSDREYYQTMVRTGRTTVADVEVGKMTGRPSIHLAAPIWSGGTTTQGTQGAMLGSCVGAIGLGYLQDVTTKSVAVFGDMQARVLDRRYHVVVDSNRNGRPPLTDLSGVAMYVSVPSGPALLRVGRSELGEDVHMALARVPEQGLDWTVAVMRPADKIEAQARRARIATLIAIFAALILGIGLAYVLSSWLAHPISGLARYTGRVANGETVGAPVPDRWDAREVTELVETVGSMVSQLQRQADILREREKEQVVVARFRQELEIAERIQTGILPKSLHVPGFEIAASMLPAEAVGGDYYELLPTAAGFWIAVGDVSGHGLNAGLIMLMLQSALAAVARHAPDAGPAAIVRATNRQLVENIRRRLGGDDHATLVLMHVASDGSYRFTGGHEPLLVLRGQHGHCEVIELPGPWIGIKEDLGEHLSERAGRLGEGDLLVFHSDGIVEAGAVQGKPFGIERLSAAIERLRSQPAQTICDEVVREARAWAPGAQDDDMTIVVVRRVADPVRSA
jgi:serine phosphatase RsbU (regulator of sigma subunit)